MSQPIRGISSMATRQVLAEIASEFGKRTGWGVTIESVGGVDAARRVQAGEPFDVVILARDAVEKLESAGAVVQGSRVDVVRSGVAVAVRAGAARCDISSEERVKEMVLAAPSIGYSTGPSGTELIRLFESWGIAGRLKDKLVQATPGVPVGSLVADGKAAIGIQQLSELIHVPGIDVLGPLPPAIQITTVFSGAVCAASTQPRAVTDLLAFMASPETAASKRRQGMEPA